MTKVFSALTVSADGYITGRDPGSGRGLGDAPTLFDWYFNGDTPSRVFDGFRLSEPSARVFDTAAARVGATLCGRNTYDDSGWLTGGTPQAGVPLVVLSHRPIPAMSDPHQTLVTTGIEDAVATARKLAGDKDVALMGGGVTSAALTAGLVDELILHQVPVLLGAGRPYFQALPAHIELRLVEAVPAPGVTHLHYEVLR
ncbi:dihydrofolate reductase family protein [Paractinoplanes atraurantiacus]|uniref:Dihydrofolate reductase n=1 Tax=Paractinoplanes atraurantiacus TaxID=1036182 RepID=A0A285K7X2_9ACTN|nr:dihydrofolate reductase family protein [Actinoplanes atraurantiacus]SNY68690.1 Dihydrofolate reductase [Actinoplanes atraurantiacus]